MVGRSPLPAPWPAGFVAIVPAGPEVRSIDGDHGILREPFAHPHEAQIGQIGLWIGIPVRKARELNKVFLAVKGRCYQIS
jgi:hypothetical protein